MGYIPLVAAAYDAIRAICDEMVVVLGHDADEVAAALGNRRFHRIESPPSAPMFDSIRTGLSKALSLASTASVILQPGDHPEVATSTLDMLLSRSLEFPAQAIIPEYTGRGGHPILIPHNIAALLLESECPDGLGKFWLEHPDLCHRVMIDDSKVVRDIDTPADLS